MQKIKSSGKLTVGTASGFPPYEFLDTSASDGKKIDGIDIKLAEAVAKKLGVKLEIQDMTFSRFYPLLPREKWILLSLQSIRLRNVKDSRFF